MWFWLRKLFGGSSWPRYVPRLYPDLDDRELSCFRDLMLVRQLSVRGPEDTSLMPMSAAGRPERTILVGGQVCETDAGLEAVVQVSPPQGRDSAKPS